MLPRCLQMGYVGTSFLGWLELHPGDCLRLWQEQATGLLTETADLKK